MTFRFLKHLRRANGRVCLVAVVLLSVLSACSLNLSQVNEPTPTLVATLDLPAPPTDTITPSATITLIPSATLPTETPIPTETPTQTPTIGVTDTETPGPSPTGTLTPTITQIPTRTRIPSRTPTITLTPTITFTPTPPPPQLYLVRPGLLSKLISPIHMEMYAVAGAGGKVSIELVGEDGRVISRQVISRSKDNGQRFWLAPDLPFEIDAVAETARLQISTQDNFGRTAGLSSVDVILLSVGRNEINPPAIDQEPYLIRSPEADEVVSGGVLAIDALARPVNDSPLIIELINENGIVISTKQIVVPPPAAPLSHTPFTVEIPYRVSTATPVRMVIRQEGSRIPGTVALVSRLIVLEP